MNSRHCFSVWVDAGGAGVASGIAGVFARLVEVDASVSDDLSSRVLQRKGPWRPLPSVDLSPREGMAGDCH